MRRTLLAVGVIILALVLVLPQCIYPVRVTFKFEKDNHPFEISYLTSMRIGFCDLDQCIIRWNPGRARFATPLPDGSLLISGAEWPFAWQQIRFGVKYPSQGRWMWMNRQKAPTQIVYADGAARLSPDHIGRPPFPWMVVSATIERVSEFSLIQAVVADGQPDQSADIVSSSAFGIHLADTGHLFGGIEAGPVEGDHLQDLLKLPEWTNLADGCRVLPRRMGIKLSADRGMVIKKGMRRVLLHHDDLWTDRDAVHPGEAFISYSAGKPMPFGNVILFYVRSVLREVHGLEFNGGKCTGIDLPADSYGAYVDFGDGAVVTLVPSLGFVVLRD